MDELEKMEKQRVIDTAKKALVYLRAAKFALDKAMIVGVVDIFGGMYLSSGIKHLEIESAKKNIRLAMEELQKFRRETDSTDYVNQNYMHMGILSTVFDFGFDNLASDVYAQARIAGLRRRVKEAIKRVEIILRRIELSETS